MGKGGGRALTSPMSSARMQPAGGEGGQYMHAQWSLTASLQLPASLPSSPPPPGSVTPAAAHRPPACPLLRCHAAQPIWRHMHPTAHAPVTSFLSCTEAAVCPLGLQQQLPAAHLGPQRIAGL